MEETYNEKIKTMTVEELLTKELPIEALITLKQLITDEINKRQQINTQLLLYTHNCKGCSNHHRGKYKHWAKIVKHVDISKTNGYAFEGEFISPWAEHKLPEGTIIVEVCDITITAYRLKKDAKGNKELIGEAKTDRMSALIEQLAKIVNT